MGLCPDLAEKRETDQKHGNNSHFYLLRIKKTLLDLLENAHSQHTASTLQFLIDFLPYPELICDLDSRHPVVVLGLLDVVLPRRESDGVGVVHDDGRPHSGDLERGHVKVKVEVDVPVCGLGGDGQGDYRGGNCA